MPPARQAEAAPFQLIAARAARDAQLHGDVLRRTAEADVADEATRFELLELRADALAQQGDPGAIPCYRRALRHAPPEAVPWLVARIARAHMRNGDVAAAADAMAGVADEQPPRGAPGGRLARLLPGRPRHVRRGCSTACATWPSRRVPRPRCST